MSYGTTREPTAPQREGAAERRTGGVKTTGQLRTPSSLSPIGDADQAVTGGFVLELPRPPSVNSFIGNRLGNNSPRVKQWIADCDRCVMARRPRPKPIKGKFEIHVIWAFLADKMIPHDIDNPIKPLLDYLERIELIENDRLCRRLLVEFGTAPLGCIVRARPWGA